MSFAPVLAAGALFAGDLAFWHLSIVYTTVANATLLSNFAPVWVALGGWLLFGQRVTRLFLVARGISLTGAALLVGPSFGAGERGSRATAGRRDGDVLWRLHARHLALARQRRHRRGDGAGVRP
jgi:drug/metabolite transporter (DMT)-like permease